MIAVAPAICWRIPKYGTVTLNGIEYFRTRIEDADGKRVALYAKTAEELYEKVEEAKRQIEEASFRRATPTVAEYCERWLLMQSAHIRTTTLTDYSSKVKNYIVAPLGHMYMANVTTDRLRRGIELYQFGAAPKLLMSGDHGQKDYNEVKAMKLEAMEQGIPSEDIFMDHAGFSTYESIFRARDVFAADKIIIVTQEYHLYRALHVANALGVEAYGVSADYHTYVGEAYRELREILARNKDFATSILKPEPTYLGDVIPVSGDGNLTNDEDMEPVLS